MSAFYVYPHEDREAGAVLAAVMARFLIIFPRVGLEGLKSALKESVVEYVAFSVFAAHNPVAWLYVSEAEIGGDSFRFGALGGIYKQRSARSKCAHIPPPASIRQFLLHAWTRKER
jgi:hypothetical protein